jgi:hypothetical protein
MNACLSAALVPAVGRLHEEAGVEPAGKWIVVGVLTFSAGEHFHRALEG